MDFRDFVLDDHAKIARMMVDRPDPRWREGFGKAKPEDELAAVLHYAEKGFPAGGKSLTIQPPMRGTPIYDELLKMAREMESRGSLMIDKDGFGYTYAGRPDLVREAMRITIRRKPEMLAEPEQHRAIGRMLGYSDEAIEEFMRRMGH